MKKVRESKLAAEGACDKLADGLASFARALLETAQKEMREIRGKKLSLEPVIKSLEIAVAKVEASATL